MTNLAVILQKIGKSVSGSDIDEEFITDIVLKKNKINWSVGFEPKNLPGNTELVIYSAAHQGIDNPQIKAAVKRNLKILSQAEVLGRLIQMFERSVAVCGCHGKTTTASLLSYALINLQLRPSYLVGSTYFNQFQGGDYQEKKYFVVEADEYAVSPPNNLTPKFSYLNPDDIICTNIDFDHPDVYQNIEETKTAFLKFFKQAKQRLFLSADDKNILSVKKQLSASSYLTYGFDQSADYQIVKMATGKDGTTFELKNSSTQNSFNTRLFGKKNISNVAGVVSYLLYSGFSGEKINQAIAGFSGAKRRFETVAKINNVCLFDDYAHHPAEIEATIAAARSRFPKQRIVIIFQPHTYSRTQSLLKEFAQSLSRADISLLLPIFPSARENPTDYKISSNDIVNKTTKNNTFAYHSTEAVLKKLNSIIKANDLIFTMGAGDVYKLKDDIIKIISNLKC